MDERHYEILNFISEQKEYVPLNGFPNSITSEFHGSGLGKGSFKFEIIMRLAKEKRWLDPNSQNPADGYILSKEGSKVLQAEKVRRNESSQTKDLEKNIKLHQLQDFQYKESNQTLEKEIKELQLQELRYKKSIQKLEKDLKDSQYQLVHQQRKDLKYKLLLTFAGIVIGAVLNHFLKR